MNCNKLVDWNKLKQEYIAGGISYRKLAEKYEVSESTLSKRAMVEKWAELKAAAAQESNRRIIKVVANRQRKRAEKIQNVADKVLRGIESIVDEALNGEGAQLDKTALKQITGALKDLKEIHGLKSELDTREQKARINKLERDVDASGNDGNEGHGVLMMPDICGELKAPSEEQDNE